MPDIKRYSDFIRFCESVNLISYFVNHLIRFYGSQHALYSAFKCAQNIRDGDSVLFLNIDNKSSYLDSVLSLAPNLTSTELTYKEHIYSPGPGENLSRSYLIWFTGIVTGNAGNLFLWFHINKKISASYFFNPIIAPTNNKDSVIKGIHLFKDFPYLPVRILKKI